MVTWRRVCKRTPTTSKDTKTFWQTQKSNIKKSKSYCYAQSKSSWRMLSNLRHVGPRDACYPVCTTNPRVSCISDHNAERSLHSLEGGFVAHSTESALT